MRLPPRRVNRVVWEEGMFLAPQHFQAQRRHFEESLGHTIDALFPFAYAPKRSVQAGGIAAPLALIALLLG